MRVETHTANKLANAIKRHATAPMTDADAMDAVSNLTGFFKLLIQIDKEIQKKK